MPYAPSPLHAAAADIITNRLTGDLRHPTRPNIPLVFPGMRIQGHHDPQIADAITETARLLGQALIYAVLTELDAELVPKDALAALTARAANAPSQLVTLACKHGPLIQAAVKPGTNTAEINCRRLRESLAECEAPKEPDPHA